MAVLSSITQSSAKGICQRLQRGIELILPQIELHLTTIVCHFKPQRRGAQ